MSRSIHTTIHHIEEAKRWDFSDPEHREQLIQALEEQSATKRRIKRRINRERSAPGEFLPPADLGLMPVVVRDDGPYVHFPASVDDIRSLMYLLPCGVLDGLNGIELSLGANRQDKYSDIYEDNEDPYTGRIGREILPSVFSGRCMAVYTLGERKIRVFAYVYPPELQDREMWECYLRLHMLSSFVHEAAHHYDSVMRVARGRWRMDDDDKVEGYAESVQYDWVRDYVIPYLERTYAEQVNSLVSWVEYHGGVSIPLSMLAGDSRAPWNNGQISAVSAFFGMPSAIGHLAQGVFEGEKLVQTRLQFARELHYGEHYEPALQIIERILVGAPDNPDACALKADIFEHQDRYSEANALIDKVLAADPNHKDSLWVRMDICEETRDWQGLLNVSTYLLTNLELNFGDEMHVIFHRAKACLELDDYTEMNADLEVIEGYNWGVQGIPRYWRRKIEELRAEVGQRQARALDCQHSSYMDRGITPT